jgi:hypothetical protein
MDDASRPDAAASMAENSVLLGHLAEEISQQLARHDGRMRHVFFILRNKQMPAEQKSLVYATVGCALGGDTYESFFAGPIAYPVAVYPGANLWHLFLANDALGSTAKDRWWSTLSELDRIVHNGSLSIIVPDLACADGWLMYLYRLSWRRPDLCCWTGPWGGSFAPHTFTRLQRGETEFDEWLSNADTGFVGEHMAMLPDDVRICSLRALRVLQHEAILTRSHGLPNKYQMPKRKRGGQVVYNREDDDRTACNVAAMKADGMTYKEIADRLGMPFKRLRQLLDRRRKRIQGHNKSIIWNESLHAVDSFRQPRSFPCDSTHS